MLSALLVTSSADAQKVSNPGAFSINPTGGYIALGNQLLDLTPKTLAECQDGVDNFDSASGPGDGKIDFVPPAGSVADPQCASAVDNSELIPGVQALEATTINGTIDSAGNVSIPAASVSFPTYFIKIVNPVDGVLSVVFAKVKAVGTQTGTLNPLTGVASIRLKFYISLTGNAAGADLGSNCNIGTTGSPIDVNALITGVTAPPAPNTAIAGVNYSAVTGAVVLVNNSFSVPAATGCPNPGGSIFTPTNPYNPFDVQGVINQNLLLPSAAGKNTVVLATTTAPVLGKGLVAKITTTPTLLNGPAPFSVAFSAATSTVRVIVAP
jgi:hypothetical protein